MHNAPHARIALILNVRAGPGHGPEQRQRLEKLFREAGLEPAVFEVRDGEQARAATRRALDAGARIVVAAGGDGTVSAVAAGLRGKDAALAVLPVGTLNHFARDLGIPQDPAEAIAAIACGVRVGVDVGQVNERVFINNASLGIYPDIVRDRTRQQRRLGRGKYWAMLWATLAVLRRSPFVRMRMEIEGHDTVECRSPFVFVGNNDYVMEGFSIGTRSSLRDGCLSVYTTRRRGRLALLGLALRALVGRLHQADDFSSVHASRLRIETRHRRLWVATDGELNAMMTPLEFRVLPGALRVIVPG
jgi:YegS/Rv2252/BmrU family lipid kinase